eukprot:7113390-Pyramimonas_sp.AAC.1
MLRQGVDPTARANFGRSVPLWTDRGAGRYAVAAPASSAEASSHEGPPQEPNGGVGSPARATTEG